MASSEMTMLMEKEYIIDSTVRKFKDVGIKMSSSNDIYFSPLSY